MIKKFNNNILVSGACVRLVCKSCNAEKTSSRLAILTLDLFINAMDHERCFSCAGKYAVKKIEFEPVPLPHYIS